MTEIIRSIEEVTNYGVDDYGYGGEDGYKITTTEQEILLLISNGQSCCEDWGYLMSEDDLTKFVGIELYGIEITDTNRTDRVITRGTMIMVVRKMTLSGYCLIRVMPCS